MFFKKFSPAVLSALAVLFFAMPAQAALTATQVDSIMGLLRAFGADQSVIANVQASLMGTPIPTTPSSCVDLSYSLYTGQTDPTTNGDVTRLQNFLGVSPTGYFGPMTEQAVQKWQAAHGIVSSGSPDTTGYGLVGPQTSEAMGCSNSTSVSTSTTNNTQTAEQVSVPGMSKYADSSFGFSFWYPSGWTVIRQTASSSFSGGTIVGQLQVKSSPGKYFTLDEVNFPSDSITTGDAGCMATYAFNNVQSGWTQTVSGCDGATNTPQPYHPDGAMTMGGLITIASQEGLSTVYSVVPLSWKSGKRAVVVTGESTGFYRGQELSLVKTIAATNPAAATPESAAQQTTAIQAEASAYGIALPGTVHTSATIDQSSLTSTAIHPIITGAAQGVSSITVEVVQVSPNQGPDWSATVPVQNGKWSFVPTDSNAVVGSGDLSPAHSYKVLVWAPNNDGLHPLTSGTLTVLDASTGALSASCHGNPYNSGTPGISWGSSASGGTGSYTYQWTLANDPTGTGDFSNRTQQSVLTTYGSAGTKSASVMINSGSQSTTANCSATISVVTIDSNSLTTSSANPTITGTASSLSYQTVRVVLSGTNGTPSEGLPANVVNGRWTASFNGSTLPGGGNLSQGSYLVTVYATDMLGNQTTQLVTGNLTVR